MRNALDTRLRCWNKRSKKMTLSFPLYKSNFYDCDNVDELVVMFGTGLKDKNGKEIFEGDRVRILYTDWASKEDSDTRTIEQYKKDISIVGVVVWWPKRAGFLIEFKDGSHGPLNEGLHGEKEVMGNIYDEGGKD